MNVKLVQFKTIQEIDVKPKIFVDWVKESFLEKKNVILPKKISLTIRDNVFFNFMPSILPNINTTGLKVVTRIPDRNPALQAQIYVYDEQNGNLQVIMDGTYITAMRTGAVAALTTIELAVSDFYEIGLVGLGNCGRAYLNCLLDSIGKRKLLIKLYNYKSHAVDIINKYSCYDNITFKKVDTYEEIVNGSDVIVSAITYADNLICENNNLYKKGCLLIPIHTRGFQNCDLFFDKVIVDDIEHVHSFKYFDKFKEVYELTDVLNKIRNGRINNNEKILSYNIGISIHDLFFAKKYLDLITSNNIKTDIINFNIPDVKVWV